MPTLEQTVADLATANNLLTTAVLARDTAVSEAQATFAATTARVNALNNVSNTSDASKPISTAQGIAIGLKQDTLVSGLTIRTVNGLSLLGEGDTVIPRGATSLNSLEYESRGMLRDIPALPRQLDDSVVIEGLGLFMWYNTQLEPDDDETCFTDALGQWLLAVPAQDFLAAINSIEEAFRDELDEDETIRLAAIFTTK